MFDRDYFLKKHNIVLDTNKSAEEQNDQMTVSLRVRESESGERPYIFVSYAHKDSLIVLPAIRALQDRGYPVWYDAGIRPGTKWSDYIADHVREAELVIAFLSENALASTVCAEEIQYARDNGRPVLSVRLDQSDLPSGLDMALSRCRMIPAYVYDGETFLELLAADRFIADTVGAALQKYNAKKRAEAEAEEIGRRIAEEAERMRKSAEEQERRRREKEIAELESQRQALTQEIGNLTAAKKRNGELAKALEKERLLRDAAERKLKGAQDQIEIMIAAEKKRNEPKQLSSEEKKAKAKLAELHARAREHLHMQNFEDYSAAIRICKGDMAQYTMQFRDLEKDRESYTNDILATMYHDARALEKRSTVKAHAIYQALPTYYEDVKYRRNDAEEAVMKRTRWICLISVVLYLVIHILLVKCLFSLSAPLWKNVLLFTGPMLIMMGIWWHCNRFWLKTDNYMSFEIKILFVIALIVCSAIALVVDPFLYPEMPVVLKVVISIGVNGLLNMLSITGFWRVLHMRIDDTDCFIAPFGEK